MVVLLRLAPRVKQRPGHDSYDNIIVFTPFAAAFRSCVCVKKEKVEMNH